MHATDVKAEHAGRNALSLQKPVIERMMDLKTILEKQSRAWTLSKHNVRKPHTGGSACKSRVSWKSGPKAKLVCLLDPSGGNGNNHPQKWKQASSTPRNTKSCVLATERAQKQKLAYMRQTSKQSDSLFGGCPQTPLCLRSNFEMSKVKLL